MFVLVWRGLYVSFDTHKITSLIKLKNKFRRSFLNKASKSFEAEFSTVNFAILKSAPGQMPLLIAVLEAT